MNFYLWSETEYNRCYSFGLVSIIDLTKTKWIYYFHNPPAEKTNEMLDLESLQHFLFLSLTVLFFLIQYISFRLSVCRRIIRVHYRLHGCQIKTVFIHE